MRKIAALATAAMVVAAFAGVAGAANPKPVTVWEDPEGDADMAQGVSWGTQAGLDIVKGEIARNGKNLEFTVTHAAMPPFGSLPETFRFLWAFNVDGTDWRLTVKRADIGKPDVGQSQTTERVGRVDTDGHWRLEGDCGATPAPAVLEFINCKPIAYLDGSWDSASNSFTMVVPMKLVKAKPGSVIQAGGGDAIRICPICWVSHIAERSADTTVVDEANQTAKYKVPKK